MVALTAPAARVAPTTPPPSVELSLRAVEARMAAVMAQDEDLARIGAHLVMAGGAKRARPMLVASVAAALGEPTFRADHDHNTDIAAAIELLHGASLIHDDIVDDSHERRGRTTVHLRSGSSAAVLAGDWVLAQALQLAIGCGMDVVKAFANAVADMSRAAQREHDLRATVPSLHTWAAVARGKTGVLFGLCAAGPALLQGKHKLAQALHESLCAWGAAFQAIDDVIDFVGGADKPLWRDLAERNPSYPIIAAAAEPSLRQELESLWSSAPSDGDVTAMAKRIMATGACLEALRFAAAELSRARSLLSDHADVQQPFLLALQPVFAWADAHLAGVEDRLSLASSNSAAAT